MATITYPTQQNIEDYLNEIYGKKLSLSGSIKIIGTNTEAHPKDDQKGYGLLDEVEVNALTGVDIPILITGDKGDKGTIAIVAQDPLRSESDGNLPKYNNKIITDKIIVGTPFAFHYKKESYLETEVYRKIVESLLNDGYRVYITDAHKIYPNKTKVNINKDERDELEDDLKKKNIKDKIGRLNTEQLLLFKELKQLKQLKCVVTFGEEAYKYLKSPIFQEYKKVTLLHPSQQNWTNWKLWIYEQQFWDNNNKGFWEDRVKELGERKDFYSSKKNNENNKENKMILIISAITNKQIALELQKVEKDNC